ncbi:MAG: hypothetical protein R8K21_06235 [Mariprofundales bacterium]
MLANFQRSSNCTLLYALKALTHPTIINNLHLGFAGCSVASVAEAKLVSTNNNSMFIHGYAPAWQQKDLSYILSNCDSMSCNTLAQWQKVRQIQLEQKYQQCSIGLRINPCINQAKHYNPAHPQSRFGELASSLAQADWPVFTGLHAHALAGANAEHLAYLLEILSRDFAPALEQAQWLNLGGGHRLCDANYNQNKAAKLLRDFASYWCIKIYLEPGEAVLRGIGGLQASVIDIIPSTKQRQKYIFIVNSSRLCHLPLLAYQQQAELDLPMSSDDKYSCIIASDSCLSNDVFGHYQLEKLPKCGDHLLFPNTVAYQAMFASPYNSNPVPQVLVV